MWLHSHVGVKYLFMTLNELKFQSTEIENPYTLRLWMCITIIPATCNLYMLLSGTSLMSVSCICLHLLQRNIIPLICVVLHVY